MICDSDVWDDTWRTRRNGRDPHSDAISGLAGVKPDLLTVGVDGLAGINLKPLAAAVEVSLEGQREVGSTSDYGCKAELAAISVNLQSVVN